MERDVAVWDVPTRVFHWSLVGLLLVMVATGKAGGDWLALHQRCGEILAGLLLFRLAWGMVGSQSARFADFVKGPRAVARYLKNGDAPTPGHNPLGGWMVLAMLLVLVLQVASGLFAADVDSYLFDGPYAHHLAPAVAEAVTGWHKRLFTLVLGLSGVHLLAIAAYRLIKRQNLLRPMLTGRKRLAPHVAAPFIASWRIALVCAVLAAVAVLLLLARA